MSREEIQRLLGGYATDTLSEAERSALFAAALEDQELFEALAKEQALRDVLQDAAARQQLIEALETKRQPIAARAWRWVLVPAGLAVAVGAMALLIVGGFDLRRAKPPARRQAVVADAIALQPAPPAPPAAAPLSNIRPRTAPRRLLRLPAPSTPEPSAPLPPPPELTASRNSAMPAGALAGAAGAAGAANQMNPAMPAPVLSFAARSSAPVARLKGMPMASLKKAEVAIGYALLLKGADGLYAPAPPGAVFHAGDSVRIQVAPKAAGYIYLYRRNTSGGWEPIATQAVEEGQGYVLPAVGGLQSDAPAQVELLLVLSRAEQNATGGALAANTSAGSLKITLEFR
jgi:hypothetical protein